jgi:hypothetical protein
MELRMNDDLDIPAFLIIPAARRKAAWKDFKPHPTRAPTSIERWKQYELQRREEIKKKIAARIEALRAAKGLESFYDR